MAKRKKIKKVFKNGSSETGAVLEYIEDQVKIIAEQTSRMPNIEEKIGRIEETMEVMKMDIELIKHGFKMKVDIEEFEALEKRVSILENRR